MMEILHFALHRIFLHLLYFHVFILINILRKKKG